MKIRKIPPMAVTGIILLLSVLSISCLKPVDFSADLIVSNGTNLAPAVDDPDEGAMSRVTADHIFNLETDGAGLKITKFKSASRLAAYLLQSSSARAVTITVSMTDTFKIPVIDNMPVLSIAAGAFAPANLGGEDDISTVIQVLELPAALQSLGEGLFGAGNMYMPIFLDIPVTAPLFQGKDQAASDAVAAKAAGNFVVARIYNPAAPEDRRVVLPAGINEFKRPTANSVEYRIGFYDNATGLASLSTGGDYTQYKVTDSGLRKLFNTVYSPNAPETTDTVESGKTAIKYNAAISQAALGLFKITVGQNSAGDKAEIKGNILPDAANATSGNLIVIDIGIPGEDNSGLTFSIPDRGLGSPNGLYAHVRFRVNKGACLVIQADNSAYEVVGVGNSCPTGYFNGGCVEVMAGGKLRDTAWEGFPLGNNAVILSRSGSYLAIGAESYKDNGTDKSMLDYTGADFQKYYAGWLIGPTDESQGLYGGSVFKPRIVWDAGQGAEKYIEIRHGEIAIDAKVTIRRSFGLIYSVWFIGDSSLAINIDKTETVIFGTAQNQVHGVFANGDDYNFYGHSQTVITIFPGNVLDTRFLNTTQTAPIGPASGQGSLVIRGADTGTLKDYVDSSTGISGFQIPYPAKS
jgi:hypothetical protein